MAKKRAMNKWSDAFQQMVERNLRNSITLVNENLGQPDVFRNHFESLMSQAQWGYSSCPELSATLLLTMHPWPARWALIHSWGNQLELAANIPEISMTVKRQILACLADVYKVAGLSEKVIEIAESLFSPPLADPQEYASLIMQAGGSFIMSLTSIGKLEYGEEMLQKMEQYLAVHDSAPRTVEFGMACAIVQMQKSFILRRKRQLPQALALVTDAIAQLDHTDVRTRSLLSQIIESRANFHRAAGNYNAALADLDSAQAQIGLGENMALSSLHGNRGLCYLSMSRYTEAEQELLRAIEIAEDCKAYTLMGRQIGPLSLISFCKGDVELALRRSERHIEIAAMIRDVSEGTIALANQACMLIYANQAQNALPQLISSLNTALTMGHQEWVVLSHFDLAICYYTLADLPNLAHHAQQAYENAQNTDNKIMKLLSMRILALSLPPNDALALLVDALQISRLHERLFDEAGCLLFLAHLESDSMMQTQYWNSASLILEDIGAARWLENREIGDPIMLPALL